MGLVRPRAATSGSGSARCAAARPRRSRARGVALVPEGRRIFGELTVDENLRLGLARPATAGARRGRRARSTSSFPSSREFRPRQAGALSGGQQQQLAIARALVARPGRAAPRRALARARADDVDVVFEALAEIRDRGSRSCSSSSARSGRSRFADRSYVLANGELRLTLTPDDAADTERMVRAYLVVSGLTVLAAVDPQVRSTRSGSAPSTR